MNASQSSGGWFQGPHHSSITFAVLILTIHLLVPAAAAQVRLTHSVLGGGFVLASGPNHRLAGTVGQPLAGGTAGFWSNPALVTTAIEQLPGEVPAQFALHQSYPNPFNPSTTIRYDVAAPAHVRLAVYDLLGRQVGVLVDERQPAGGYAVHFDAGRLASGTYLYVVEMGAFRATRTFVVLK